MPGFGSNVVESPQRQINVLMLRKTGAGTPVLSGLCASFCTVTDNGVGDFTINVNNQRPSSQNLIAVATPHTSGIIRQDVSSANALNVRFKCFAVDGTTPAELDFDMVIYACFARDLIS